MAKWYGVIGYAETVETEPGDWEEKITERSYFGDIIRNSRMLQNSGEINDNINISNQISIVADPYASSHIYAMRYIEFQNTKWKVSNVDVQYPRLILSLGGIYNGEQA
jgi:hypothetical protein